MSWKWLEHIRDDIYNEVALLMLPRDTAAFVLVALLLCAMATAQADPVTGEDSDHDGLSDVEEAREYHTDSQLLDTDTDGLSDGDEVHKYWTLPLVVDSDGDGYLDGVEVRLGTDPTNAASHPQKGKPGYDDLDGDGVSNAEERSLGTDPQRVDSDFDGLTDFDETRRYFTDPMLVDSDGDSVWDGEEVKAGSDPTEATSRPKAEQRQH
jgi:hypothetical protein